MTDNIQSITARDESMNEGRNLDNFHSSAESYFFGNKVIERKRIIS